MCTYQSEEIQETQTHKFPSGMTSTWLVYLCTQVSLRYEECFSSKAVQGAQVAKC